MKKKLPLDSVSKGRKEGKKLDEFDRTKSKSRRFFAAGEEGE